MEGTMMTDESALEATREVLAHELREQGFNTIADDVLSGTYETYAVPRNLALRAMLAFATRTPSPAPTLPDAERVEAAREALARAAEAYGCVEVPPAIRAGEVVLINSEIALAALAALPSQTGVREGWKLVPATATRAWAVSLAEQRQGQRAEPRCEPPGEADIRWASERISEALAAAPTLDPADSKEGE